MDTGYDAELRRHTEVLRRAVGVQIHEHIPDIGCGTGQTTRQAARTARAGSALGVDVRPGHRPRLGVRPGRRAAPPHLRARRCTGPPPSARALRRGHQQVRRDVLRDPGAAFANIDRALRPAGRLVMMVWQAHDRNEWAVVIRQSLGAAGQLGTSPSGAPDPFSLADPPAVTQILAAAGFGDVAFTDVHEPVYYRPDVAAALDWVRGFACTSAVLKRLDPAAAARAGGRLRQVLAAHLSEDGVWFSSRAWIVTDRCR